eukprot:scaffold1389_cov251-Ochromonas_danica.AAC.5
MKVPPFDVLGSLVWKNSSCWEFMDQLLSFGGDILDVMVPQQCSKLKYDTSTRLLSKTHKFVQMRIV